MKKLLLAAVAAFALPAMQAPAAVTLYEPFDYTAGSDLKGANPAGTDQAWELCGTDTANNLEAVSPGLSVTGLSPTGVGNAGKYIPNGDTLRIGIQNGGTNSTSGSIFYSLAFVVNDLGTTPTLNGTGSFIGGLNNLVGPQGTVPGVVAAKLRYEQVTGDGTDYYIGTQSNGGTSAFDTTTVYHPGDQVFVVLEYNIDTMISNLWINPSAVDFSAGSPPTPDATSGAGTAPTGGIGSFVLRANSVAPAVTVDELRIGTSWADVTPVPEPAGLATLGLAAGAMFVRRRRRE